MARRLVNTSRTCCRRSRPARTATSGALGARGQHCAGGYGAQGRRSQHHDVYNFVQLGERCREAWRGHQREQVNGLHARGQHGQPFDRRRHQHFAQIVVAAVPFRQASAVGEFEYLRDHPAIGIGVHQDDVVAQLGQHDCQVGGHLTAAAVAAHVAHQHALQGLAVVSGQAQLHPQLTVALGDRRCRRAASTTGP
ncbi:MAG: hypothetical protein KatS3mg051_1622 [Anaerolineae bacterium]|nr:MAG: hypothetical protein KatS3mg051_1622 [Anaerolineae bacterium]